ncbi:hypothetical protein KW797_01760 [Candidatus Parcubacteria bacterium]|nr:hypothetical protein [Candidatus Parcubacteria bacterium]
MSLQEQQFLGEMAQVCKLFPYPAEAPNAYSFRFHIPPATVTIWIRLDDARSGADVLITRITVFPEESKGRKAGTEAVQKLLAVAIKCELRDIKAVWVKEEERLEGFWKKNGFSKLPNGDFQYLLPS